MDNWYDLNIEEPIREIVRLLRDNGFNTLNSCGHEMTIDLDWGTNHNLDVLHRLLFDSAIQNYMIEIIHEVMHGHGKTLAFIFIKESIEEIRTRKNKWIDAEKIHNV